MAIVVLYLGTIAGIGLWMSRGTATTGGYFVADRQVPRWVVGFTLMATLISSNTLVAHPAIVYQKGMILVPGFMVLPFVLILVAYYVVPFYRRVVGMSAYEYIGRRFGLGGRLYTSLGFLLERTFDLGVTLVTTAVAVNVMTGWELTSVILGIGLFTMAYTTLGGIRAVVWTDAIQGVLLIGGGFLILLRLLFAPEAGAPFAVVGEAWRHGRFDLGSTEVSWQSLQGSGTPTLWVFLFAMALQWSRRFICDQHMVQRYLLAKTDAEARRGTLLGALLSVPVLVLFNLIGALLFGFYQLAPTAAPAIGDQILPHFIVHHLPAGVIGLMLAAILAASMSSMSSDLNSLATVLTRDYIQRFWPRLDDRRLLRLGRLMVSLCGLVAIWLGTLLIPSESTLPIAERALTIAVIVSAGSLGLFSLGFLTRRATRTGAYAGIVACVLFTSWGVLTEPGAQLLDLGRFNFGLNTILIGVLGHFLLFGVGYVVSLVFGGYRPADLDDLVRSSAQV
ncbi:MAG: sodium/solute symporter [Acidobacteriota bacterium]